VEVTRVQASEGKRRMTPVTWTLLVIVIGLAIGIIASLFPRPRTRLEPFETITTIDIVVSALNLALIVCLLYVYARTYSETKARFALGLFIVLGAFLFQAILTSPIFYAALGQFFAGGRPSMVLAADAFAAFAFATFLYLSLQ